VAARAEPPRGASRLCCAEGLTNAKIGGETLKFDLRNTFAKFGVRRRTEMVAGLLMSELGRDER